MTFDIPQEYANEIDEGVQMGVIRLPFTTPYFKWLNGDPAKASLRNAQYYGGWQVGRDRLEETMANLSGREKPISLTEADLPSSQGTYPGFVTRYLSVAVFGRRYRWLEEDNKSHVQWLAWLADFDREQKKFTPWGPVVFYGYGMSTLEVDNAINEWASKTSEARSKIANAAKHWFFYIPLGTFLNEPQFKEVGSNQKSSITPCQTIVPDEVTEEYLTRHFVGQDVAALMVDHKRQAERWLSAWDDRQRKDDVQPSDFQPKPPPPPEFPEYASSNEDIPF